jgi:hypothetical protein
MRSKYGQRNLRELMVNARTGMSLLKVYRIIESDYTVSVMAAKGQNPPHSGKLITLMALKNAPVMFITRPTGTI